MIVDRTVDPRPIPDVMRAEWNRLLVERRARRAMAALASTAPTPSLLAAVTRPAPTHDDQPPTAA